MGCNWSKGAASGTKKTVVADGNQAPGTPLDGNDGLVTEGAVDEQMEKSGEEFVEDLAATQQALVEAASRMPNLDAASFGMAKAIGTLASVVKGTDFKVSLMFPVEFAVRVFFNAAIGVCYKSECFFWFSYLSKVIMSSSFCR